MGEDLYAVLGIQRGVTQADVKKAYRQIARKYHPDKNPGDESAAKIFADAAEAYRVLGDAELKAKYDQYGRTSAASGPTPAAEAPGDVFGDIFGGGRKTAGRGAPPPSRGGRGPAPPSRGAPRRAPQQQRAAPQQRGGGDRGEDLRYTLEIDFEDAAFGCNRRISVPRRGRCNACGGTGARAGTAPIICQACGGQGQRRDQGFFGGTCDQCDGTGRLIHNPCADCRGSGSSVGNQAITVNVPAGVESGTRLRIQSEGEPGPHGGPPGDLYVVVQYKPHPFFKREGDDLVSEIPVRFNEAAMGATLEVPTLDGKVRMRIPPGSQSGRVFRLKGKGMPTVNGRARGDQRVKIIVEVPIYVDQQQAQLLEQWADAEDRHQQNPMVRDFMQKLDDYYGEDYPDDGAGAGPSNAWGD